MTYKSQSSKDQRFIKQSYEELIKIEERVNQYFENCEFINVITIFEYLKDDEVLQSLTNVCITLNTDPILESIRKDNNVTYLSRMQEEREVRMSKSPLASRTSNNNSFMS